MALVITYTGTLLAEANDGIKLLLSRGCRVVVITANEQVGERLSGADCAILLPDMETRGGRIATYYSQECIRYVLNCIYGEIFARTWADSMEARERYKESALPGLE